MPLSLGPAAGIAGPRRLDRARHRRALRRLCRPGCPQSRRPGDAMADPERAVGARHPRAWTGTACAGAAGPRRDDGGAASPEPGAWRRGGGAAYGRRPEMAHRHGAGPAAGTAGRRNPGQCPGGADLGRGVEPGHSRPAAARHLSRDSRGRFREAAERRRPGAHPPADRFHRRQLLQPDVSEARPGRDRRQQLGRRAGLPEAHRAGLADRPGRAGRGAGRSARPLRQPGSIRDRDGACFTDTPGRTAGLTTVTASPSCATTSPPAAARWPRRPICRAISPGR